MASQLGITGRVKNSFLDFRDEDSESDDDQRPSSDPTSQSSSCSNWSESEESTRGCTYKFRGEGNLKQPMPLPVSMRGNAGRDDNREHAGQHGGTEQPKVQKKSMRPCRGKREKFRKYVDKLKSQMAEDPEGFTMDTVDFPKNLVNDDKGRKKVASILEKYRTQALSPGTTTQAHNPDIVSL